MECEYLKQEADMFIGRKKELNTDIQTGRFSGLRDAFGLFRYVGIIGGKAGACD